MESGRFVRGVVRIESLGEFNKLFIQKFNPDDDFDDESETSVLLCIVDKSRHLSEGIGNLSAPSAEIVSSNNVFILSVSARPWRLR